MTFLDQFTLIPTGTSIARYLPVTVEKTTLLAGDQPELYSREYILRAVVTTRFCCTDEELPAAKARAEQSLCHGLFRHLIPKVHEAMSAVQYSDPGTAMALLAEILADLSGRRRT